MLYPVLGSTGVTESIVVSCRLSILDSTAVIQGRSWEGEGGAWDADDPIL